jgi:type I restriction enzyme S subunit
MKSILKRFTSFVKMYPNKFIQGGQGNLSGDIIKSLEVNFPKDPKEQQKIANTLSTLDSLFSYAVMSENHLRFFLAYS